MRQHAQLEGRRQRQQLEGIKKIYEAREGRRRPDQKRRRAVVARRRQRRARHVREDRHAEQQLHLGQLREGAGALREAVGLLVLFCFGCCGWLLFLVLILLVVLRFSSSYGLEFVEVDVCHLVWLPLGYWCSTAASSSRCCPKCWVSRELATGGGRSCPGGRLEL